MTGDPTSSGSEPESLPRLLEQTDPVVLPLPEGRFSARAFRIAADALELPVLGADPGEHLALTALPSSDAETAPAVDAPAPLVRMHSECLTGDVLGSHRCDCGPQLHLALRRLAAEGGTLLYLRRQEGRGIGLVEKLRAYGLQDDGLDTVDANEQLGLPAEARTWGAAAVMLRALGLTRIRLLSNNPAKQQALEAMGIRVQQLVPHEIPAQPLNHDYLATKRDRMHHRLRHVEDLTIPTPNGDPR